jgi:hypothetical protein
MVWYRTRCNFMNKILALANKSSNDGDIVIFVYNNTSYVCKHSSMSTS